jgi:hypothetical protein
MLEAVKLAIPISTNAYDADLNDLIAAALSDLGIAGVTAAGKDTDPLVKRAVITYCRKNFGSPDDYERLARSYDEQKAQLSMASGYTDWGEADGNG